jgi:polyisoprenoid-binding protein YceI
MKFASPLLTLSAALAGLITASAASAAEYNTVVADKSAINFQSKQMGVAVQGRFPKFSAQLAFDPAKPEAAKVSMTIDTSAIDAGSKDANDEVVGKQWFNVKMFPTATFTSSTVKALGGNKYEVSGPLSIKGKSQPIKAAVTFKTDGANGIFDGSFTLKRLDFAIGEGPWADVDTVANDVQVNFHVVAAPAAAKK